MRGKSGAIRMAAELGVPIVPAAHWGVHKVLGNYNLRFRPNPFHLVKVKIGDPIQLSIGTNPTIEQVNQATELVMNKVAALVGEMRGETPPAKLWDPTQHQQDETGNFRKKK
jgi:1-acyl-sn-glycerol-3-phosphate acyltransferase